jgi:peptidoglycan/LPS O-acetylase OafA/YrhL
VTPVATGQATAPAAPAAASAGLLREELPRDGRQQDSRRQPESSGRPRHLDAVDIVRVAMVAGVIAVHVLAYTTDPNDVTAGAVTALLHINREVFFFLTPFVLTYSYAGRHGWSLRRFWSKRYVLVGAPYLAWTLVYLLADGGPFRPLGEPLHRLASDLLTGGARYHLYFLLVTMEIYAVFPGLLWLLRATRRHHGALLAASLVFQLAFTTALHYGIARPPLLAGWFAHPDALLPSYLLYLVAGGVAAMHLDELRGWVREHGRISALIAVGGLAAGVGSYLVDHYLVGMTPAAASEVFQPMVAVTAAGAVVGLYAVGLRWADRGAARRLQRPVKIASDASFGVYLAHPLLLQGGLLLAAPLVRAALAGSVPSGLVVALDLLVVVPVLFVVTGLLVRRLRYSRASLFLAGRPRLSAAPLPGPQVRTEPGVAVAIRQ